MKTLKLKIKTVSLTLKQLNAFRDHIKFITIVEPPKAHEGVIDRGLLNNEPVESLQIEMVMQQCKQILSHENENFNSFSTAPTVLVKSLLE